MRNLISHLIFILFFSHISIASGNQCISIYSSEAHKSTLKSMQLFIDQSLSDFQNICNLGAQSCSVGAQKAITSTLDGAKLSISVTKKVAFKSMNLFKVIGFSLESKNIREDIVLPISNYIVGLKTVQNNIVRVQNGENIDFFQKKALLSKITFGLLKTPKKSREEVLKELIDEEQNKKTDLWAQTIFSTGLLGFGLSKASVTVSVDFATGMITASKGNNLAYEATKKLVLSRFQKAFSENNDIPLMQRLRVSIIESMSFKASEEAEEMKKMIYQEFGFDQLLKAIEMQ